MDLEQLTGRFRRLKDELAAAYSEKEWPARRIDRLAQDIDETEQDIAAATAKRSKPSRDGMGRTGAPPVTRNRLTPFGQRSAEPAPK